MADAQPVPVYDIDVMVDFSEAAEKMFRFCLAMMTEEEKVAAHAAVKEAITLAHGSGTEKGSRVLYVLAAAGYASAQSFLGGSIQ